MHCFIRPLATMLLSLAVIGAARGAEPTQLVGVAINDGMPAIKASLDEREIVYSEVGMNRYTGGPMLDARGAGFEIEGLKSVRFIFTPANSLAGAVMTLNKSRYRDLVGILKRKYQLVDEEVAFVGNQTTDLKAPDGTLIFVDAPHMSFEMTVTYATQEFVRKSQEVNRAEQQAKKNREAEQF